jgi:hypothetical protein
MKMSRRLIPRQVMWWRAPGASMRDWRGMRGIFHR